MDKGGHRTRATRPSRRATPLTANGPLPSHVERFLIEHISSVAELEALILVHRRAPDALGPDDVGRDLRIEPAWAAAALHELARRGILEERTHSAPRYRYVAGTATLDETVAALVQIYAERPVQVIKVIFGKPNPNVLGFADAFRLRKD